MLAYKIKIFHFDRNFENEQLKKITQREITYFN